MQEDGPPASPCTSTTSASATWSWRAAPAQPTSLGIVLVHGYYKIGEPGTSLPQGTPLATPPARATPPIPVPPIMPFPPARPRPYCKARLARLCRRAAPVALLQGRRPQLPSSARPGRAGGLTWKCWSWEAGPGFLRTGSWPALGSLLLDGVSALRSPGTWETAGSSARQPVR